MNREERAIRTAVSKQGADPRRQLAQTAHFKKLEIQKQQWLNVLVKKEQIQDQRNSHLRDKMSKTFTQQRTSLN